MRRRTGQGIRYHIAMHRIRFLASRPLRRLLAGIVWGAGAAACRPLADQLPPDKTAPPPPAPALTVADASATSSTCLAPASCATVTVTLPRLRLRAGLSATDSAALVPIVAALNDSLRTLAGIPAEMRLQRHADRLRDRLFRDLRADGRRMREWGMGFSRATTVRVRWVSAHVLTVELEESAFTGGAHGDYGATLRSFDLRTAKPIPVTALVSDTAALVPLLESGFVLAKADSGAAPPPLADLLFPEVKRLPVPPHVGVVPEGLLFLYNPYEVAPWAVGRTDVLLTWKQLSTLADAGRWGAR